MSLSSSSSDVLRPAAWNSDIAQTFRLTGVADRQSNPAETVQRKSAAPRNPQGASNPS